MYAKDNVRSWVPFGFLSTIVSPETTDLTTAFKAAIVGKNCRRSPGVMGDDQGLEIEREGEVCRKAECAYDCPSSEYCGKPTFTYNSNNGALCGTCPDK